ASDKPTETSLKAPTVDLNSSEPRRAVRSLGQGMFGETAKCPGDPADAEKSNRSACHSIENVNVTLAPAPVTLTGGWPATVSVRLLVSIRTPTAGVFGGATPSNANVAVNSAGRGSAAASFTEMLSLSPDLLRGDSEKILRSTMLGASGGSGAEP